ncbi:tyrosine-type recombinase/integrase [Kluyvera georgiana]|uniref:tyrosine-type recombinase/integrase n=1 Tax=Kluyvera georgiana TaxID=73098 RepID=UPI000B019696
MCSICVDSFMLENGERYCHVVNKDTGEPLYYPNLYITTQVRNRSESISTMKVIAGSISLLYRFFMRKNINIDERIQKKLFLAPHEIEDLIEFTSLNFRDGGDGNFRVSNVKKTTKYFRITTVANYLEWLCKILLSHAGQKNTLKEVMAFINNIKRKKPRNNDKYNMEIEKSLDKAQLDSLFSILSPGSNLNPFTEKVQQRNNLIFLLLHCFGLRAGELLNLRIGDIDFAESTIAIRRRANDKTDPRVYQPLVKTCERKLIADTKLIYEISDYILNDRRKVKNSNKHDFLFITYKEGKTQGQPLSFSSYHKIVSVVRQSSSLLSGLTGHKLRHTWNYEFSKTIDKA